MALIGENGYVAISNIERTLGLTPATGMVRVVEALSCALDLNKAYTPSAALSAGRGVRNSVITTTTREGSVPCESVPLSAIGTQLYAAFGEMTDIGTLSTGSVVNTTLDGAVLKGAATIKLTDDSKSANGKIYQIGTGRNAECVKQVGEAAAGVVTLEYQTRFAHADGEAVKEVEAPFTHYYYRTDEADLPSFTLDKNIGGKFGQRFKGCRVNTFSMTGNVDETINFDFALISTAFAKLIAEADKASKLVASGTATSTVAFELNDSAGGFLTQVTAPLSNYVVHNDDTGKISYISAVNSNTKLTLQNDIIKSDDNYSIYSADYMLTTTEYDALRSKLDSFTFQQGSITKDGSAFGCVPSFTFTLNNNLNAGKCLGSGDNLGRLTALRANVEFNFDLEYKDETEFEAYQDGDTAALILTFTHDSEIIPGEKYAMSLHIPKYKKTAAPAPIQEGILVSSITGQALYDSVCGYDVRMSLKDGVYTYPIE